MFKKEELSLTHKGWDTKEHLQQFDHWNKMNRFEFLFKYGAFEEQKYLKSIIKQINKPSILDFGCATGTTNRFLRFILKRGSYLYKGVDISKTAIDKAKKYYDKKEFEVIGENSDYLRNNKFDIVYSRDTVLHQLNPYLFIESLINAANKAVILRLRTRDKGKTNFDIEKSCQFHYENYWMPYIVLNFDELLDFLKKNEKVISVKVNRSYMVLGGKNSRFLPKDLYYGSTGTSETSILITLSSDLEKRKKINIEIHNKLEGQKYLNKKKYKALIFRIISLLTNRIKKIMFFINQLYR